MIKIKLVNITNIVKVFSELIEKDMPISTSFKLTKLIKKIEEEFKAYEENRIKLVEKYAEKDSEGKLVIENNQAKFKSENIKPFNEEFQKLLDIEVNIDFEPISIKDLGENFSIKPSSLFILQDFITE